jgi:uncharacterized repeat protein (TIGR02543 family)
MLAMNFTMLYALKSRLDGYSDAKNGISKFERFLLNLWEILPYLLLFIGIVAIIVITLVVNFKRDPAPKDPKYVYFRNGDSLTKLECDNTKPLLLPYPKREGYTFGGWFYDSACTVPYVSTKRLKPNTILYAKWLKEG